MSEYNLAHLKQLEAESIHIMREVAAEFDKPMMLYAVGKNSAVKLYLALKAFYAGKIPFLLMHVDTAWKFKKMIAFRDQQVGELGLKIIVHTNLEGVDAGIGPLTHRSDKHTDIMKTQALKQALNKHNSMLLLAELGATRKNLAPRKESFPFGIRIMSGILRIKDRNSGTSTMERLIKARAFASFHFLTGPS